MHPISLGLSTSEERNAGQFDKPGRELVLKARIRRFLGLGLRSTVMPVLAADPRRGIIADRKPRLSDPLVKSDRRAHFKRDAPVTAPVISDSCFRFLPKNSVIVSKGILSLRS